MKFKYEGEEYDFRFYYDYVHSTATHLPVRQTRCTISVIDPNLVGAEKYQLLISVIATQHVRDQFCRRVGRKLALRKAIDQFMDTYVKYGHRSFANKKIRRMIWNSYFASCDKNMLPVNKKELKEKRYQDKALKEVESFI